MKRLSITLTDSQSEALEKIAAETGATKQSMIGLAISAWIDEQRAIRQRRLWKEQEQSLEDEAEIRQEIDNMECEQAEKDIAEHVARNHKPSGWYACTRMDGISHITGPYEYEGQAYDRLEEDYSALTPVQKRKAVQICIECKNARENAPQEPERYYTVDRDGTEIAWLRGRWETEEHRAILATAMRLSSDGALNEMGGATFRYELQDGEKVTIEDR